MKTTMFAKDVLLNPSAYLMAICLFVQQAIVALSTFWIVKLGQAVAQGEAFWLWLVLFVASLYVVYLPSIGAVYWQNRATFEAFAGYVERFATAHCGKVRLRGNLQYREARQPYLNQEGWLVIDEAVRFLSVGLATVFSIGLNVAAFGYLLDLRLILAYLAAGPLIVLAVAVGKGRIAAAARQAQDGRTEMMQALLPAWDSLLIGNSYNVQLWRNLFADRQAVAKKAGVRAGLLVECMATASMLISLLPVVAMLSWLIWTNRQEPVFLTMLIAALPRQLLTLHYLSEFVAFAAQWSALKTRLNGLAKATEGAADPSGGIVCWGQIEARTGDAAIRLTTLEMLREFANGYEKGRITLRGDNGSGKSSLLAMVKERERDNAFFLPPHSELVFQQSGKSRSTGEVMLAALEEIATKVKPRLLLLDEWDANLDGANLAAISAMLNQLATQCCVIEVRHRSE